MQRAGLAATDMCCLLQDRQVTVSFEGINGWVPKFFAPPGLLPKLGSRKPAKDELRQIMFGLTGALWAVYRLCCPGLLPSSF